jgi:hypothetical protein
MHNITQAANILDISEHAVIEQAYNAWFGHAPEPRLVDRAFGSYLDGEAAPHWARHYARGVVREFEQSSTATGLTGWLCGRRSGRREPDTDTVLAA